MRLRKGGGGKEATEGEKNTMKSVKGDVNEGMREREGEGEERGEW